MMVEGRKREVRRMLDAVELLCDAGWSAFGSGRSVSGGCDRATSANSSRRTSERSIAPPVCERGGGAP